VDAENENPEQRHAVQDYQPFGKLVKFV